MSIINSIKSYLIDGFVLLLSTAGAFLWIKERGEKNEVTELKKEKLDEELKAISASVNSESLDDIASSDNAEYLSGKTDQKK